MKNHLHALLLVLFAAIAPATACETTSKIESPQASYAMSHLQSVSDAKGKPCRIELDIDPTLGAESFSISARGGRVTIMGGDARGLIYGALEAREQLRDGIPVDDKDQAERLAILKAGNLISLEGALEERLKDPAAVAKELARIQAELKAQTPTTLLMEKQTNPFLRPDQPDIRHRLGLDHASDAEVFAEIRRRKDQFRG